ncbi:hypothetical protein CMUST_10510 [Corynebacterium mustelae]|uniref:Uncharacterized protein n=1 Tax=Corynebacterium mustelae TaxID=571915 RepID=A0A0G3H3L0_9CORY|nr:hypothetical protein CMUST_10510 [Corynebacterium mustelae]
MLNNGRKVSDAQPAKRLALIAIPIQAYFMLLCDHRGALVLLQSFMVQVVNEISRAGVKPPITAFKVSDFANVAFLHCSMG